MVLADTDTDPRTYTVSVTFEVWNNAAYDAGQPLESGFEVESEEFDCEQLARLQQKYGFDKVTDRHLWDGAKPVFKTTMPAEDRAHFERGQDKLFSLTLLAVDGQPPRPADQQRVADYFGVFFSNRVPDDGDDLTARPRP